MKKQIKSYLDKNIKNLRDKIIFITGATGSIGQSVVEELIYLKAQLILGVKDIEKAKVQKEELLKKYPYANITYMYVDLRKVETIYSCIEILQNKKINYMILNSGISQSFESDDEIFFVNCYAPYLFMNAFKNIPIVTTGSISYKKVKRNDTYAYSKRSLMQICYFLNENNKNVTIAHPGVTYTSLFEKRHKRLKWIMPIIKWFLPSKDKAGLSIVYALETPCNRNMWIGPRGLFEIYGKPKKQFLKRSLFDEKEIEDLINKINRMNLTKMV